MCNWNGADRICRGTVDDLGADRDVDEGAPRHIHQTIDARRLKEDARLLAEYFIVLTKLRQVNVDRSDLPAGDRKIGRVLVQAKRLAPTAFSRLRDMAGYAGDLRIVEGADADFVVRRQRVERGVYAGQVRGARVMKR